MTRLFGEVKKGWGREIIWATTDLYCGKLLKFNTDSKFSMHFHAIKNESWYVLEGEFIVRIINTETAKQTEHLLLPGDMWHNPPLVPHQLECVKQGTIIEVSTADSVEDNYRVAPGDSQQ